MSFAQRRGLVLLLVLPALAAAGEPKDRPPTPQEQYQALLKESAEAGKAFRAALEAAKTPEEKQKVLAEMAPAKRLSPKFLDLAKKNPKDPVAVDALVWVASNDVHRPDEDGPRGQALAILLRDHIQDVKLGAICQRLSYGYDKASETAWRALLEKSPHKEVRGQASLALVHYLKVRRNLAARIKEHPEEEKFLKPFDKAYVEELHNHDPAKVAKEIENILERALKECADVKMPNRGTVGDRARTELFEMRQLAIGREAPEVEGEDLDGQLFKLSDYKGKVVLIVFWGHW